MDKPGSSRRLPQFRRQIEQGRGKKKSTTIQHLQQEVEKLPKGCLVQWETKSGALCKLSDMFSELTCQDFKGPCKAFKLLPPEVWNDILGRLDKQDLNAARLVNKGFANAGAQSLVKELKVSFTIQSLGRLKSISQTRHLAQHVKKLTLIPDLECDTTQNIPQGSLDIGRLSAIAHSRGVPEASDAFIQSIIASVSMEAAERDAALESQLSLMTGPQSGARMVHQCVERFPSLSALEIGTVMHQITRREHNYYTHYCSMDVCKSADFQMINGAIFSTTKRYTELSVTCLGWLTGPSTSTGTGVCDWGQRSLSRVEKLHLAGFLESGQRYYSQREAGTTYHIETVSQDTKHHFEYILRVCRALTYLTIDGRTMHQYRCMIPFDILAKLRWPALKRVELDFLQLPAAKAVTFFRNHKDTLKHLRLRRVTINDDTASGFFWQLAKVLNLDSFSGEETLYATGVTTESGRPQVRASAYLARFSNTLCLQIHDCDGCVRSLLRGCLLGHIFCDVEDTNCEHGLSCSINELKKLMPGNPQSFRELILVISLPLLDGGHNWSWKWVSYNGRLALSNSWPTSTVELPCIALIRTLGKSRQYTSGEYKTLYYLID